MICEGLPEDLDAILVTSDLQYYDRRDVNEGERVLSGHIVAQEMAGAGRGGNVSVAGPDRCYSGRGSLCGAGAEQNVVGKGTWRRFGNRSRKRFRWVVGVAGNHDLFAGRGESFGNVFRNHPNVYPLHGEHADVDGLKIGGVSGILGSREKAWRTPIPEYRELMQLVMSDPLDILVLHMTPSVPDMGLKGDSLVNPANCRDAYIVPAE